MTDTIKSFTDLLVWQKAHAVMIDVYAFTDILPSTEKYNRIDQLRRSSSSVSANIAEGYGRYHYQENIQFCRQARGSLEETKNHIIAARDLKQVPKELSDSLIERCVEVRMLLNGYINSLQSRKASEHLTHNP